MKIAHGALVLAATPARRGSSGTGATASTPCCRRSRRNRQSAEPRGRFGSPAPQIFDCRQRRCDYRETDWYRPAEEHFAGRAAELPEKAAAGNDADLVVVASPQFLGFARDRLGAPVKRWLRAKIAKDLFYRETDEIAEAIARHAGARQVA